MNDDIDNQWDYTQAGPMPTDTAKRIEKRATKKTAGKKAARTESEMSRANAGLRSRVRRGARTITEQNDVREYLERKVKERTRELKNKNTEIAEQARRLRELSTRLLKVQDDERRRPAARLALAQLGQPLGPECAAQRGAEIDPRTAPCRLVAAGAPQRHRQAQP